MIPFRIYTIILGWLDTPTSHPSLIKWDKWLLAFRYKGISIFVIGYWFGSFLIVFWFFILSNTYFPSSWKHLTYFTLRSAIVCQFANFFVHPIFGKYTLFTPTKHGYFSLSLRYSSTHSNPECDNIREKRKYFKKITKK